MDSAEAQIINAPPSSIEAEHGVIGALLIRPESYDQIDWLSASDFYSAANRAIYHAARSLLESGQPLDVLLVVDRLRDQEQLDVAGGMEYVGSLATNTPSARNIKKYAEIVRSKALLRRLQAMANDLQSEAYEPGAEPQTLADSMESRLNDIRHGHDDSEPVPFHAALDAALTVRNLPDSGLHTGFGDLDRMLKPLQPGELIIIAGRPSMGKSGLAANIAEHVAAAKSVGLWSMEMSRAMIAERFLGWHERTGGTDAALGKLSALNLHIDTPHTLTVGGLRLRAKRLRRKMGLDLIIVDYLGLMRGEGENRTQQIGSISRGLKGLAIEMNIPVIAVAQLNRSNEARVDKRPLLSDLRESGDIEQDADIVIMVYRDEYYSGESPAKGTAEILVRKHRNGRIGMARLTFLAEHARFENYAGPPIYEPDPQPQPRRKKPSLVDFKSRAAGNY